MMVRIKSYFLRHAQNCVGALGAMSRQPVATAMTVAVIAIALAMPAALSVLVQNGRALAGSWDSVRDFSVYLAPGTPLESARRLQQELIERDSVDTASVVSADEALEIFQQDPGFAEMLGAIDSNPLPHTIIVRPEAETTPESLQELSTQLSARDDVDLVKLDTDWLNRLNSFIDLMRRGLWAVTALLLAAVIIIVGNTIRLDIQTRQKEIEVSKLLGASDAFVRRPFLYLGFWYGLAGGLIALMLLAALLLLLSGPAERLIALYGGGFDPSGISAGTAALVLAGGLTAGLGGAWSAVARHVAAIQPTV